MDWLLLIGDWALWVQVPVVLFVATVFGIWALAALALFGSLFGIALYPERGYEAPGLEDNEAPALYD